MANDIIMPQMGADMTQGKILRWLKQVGEEVRAGEIIAEIETDKATVEYEAYDSGTLKQIVVNEGETVPVGTVIAILGAPDEEVPPRALAGNGASAAPGQAEAPQEAEAETREAPSRQVAEAADAAPRQQPAAGVHSDSGSLGGEPGTEAPVGEGEGGEAAPVGEGEGGEAAPVGEGEGGEAAPVGSAPGDGRQEPISEPGPSAAEVSGLDVGGRVDRSEGARIFATPIARRLAQEHGIELSSVSGSGPNGRILKEDIEELFAARGGRPAAPARTGESAAAPTGAPAPAPAQAPAAAPARGPSGGTPYEELELNRIRQTGARRTQQSKQTAPHFYVTVKIDMGAALELRRQLNAVSGLPAKISINDLVIKAVAKTLQKHREINASYADGKLRVYQTINIGVAVGLPEGLITVVLNGVENRSVLDIAVTGKDLYERARAGRLKAEEYSGGTFTISNLGMYDVEHFAAVINPPEGAILAIASVQREPVVDGDQIRVGDIMRVTLSADHRVTDGVHAAEFLADLRKFLEEPAGLLL